MNRRTPKVLLFGHGGSANRGCEAIARSTINILRQAFGGGVQVVLASLHVSEDVEAHIPHISDYVRRYGEIRRRTPSWVRLQSYKRIMRDHVRAYRFAGYPTVDYVGKVDVCLSISGDNYCCGTPHWLYVVDRCVRAAGKRLVVWGA
ncbi:MAG: hypothetical protein HPY71_14220 [Firmicutes bacterium]|nr:hypothetical protein [Bacillota bacterium]